MSLTKRQSQLVNDVEKVLRRYGDDHYNAEVVLQVLSRSLKRSGKEGRHLKAVDTLLIPRADPSEILQEQRKRMGLTVQALAKKSGVAQPNLSAIENGRRLMGVSVAKKLAKALEINYRALL